jgi:hypothetical protein
MDQIKGPSPMGQERQRLLRLLGWEHGKPLPQLVLGLLGWHYGTNSGQLIPGRSAFGIPVERIAHFIVHYAPVKGNLNKEGPWPEDRESVIQLYGDKR